MTPKDHDIDTATTAPASNPTQEYGPMLYKITSVSYATNQCENSDILDNWCDHKEPLLWTIRSFIHIVFLTSDGTTESVSVLKQNIFEGSCVTILLTALTRYGLDGCYHANILPWDAITNILECSSSGSQKGDWCMENAQLSVQHVVIGTLEVIVPTCQT